MFIEIVDKKYTGIFEMISNTKIFFCVATSKIKSKARNNDDERSAIETLQSAMTSIHANDPNLPTRSGDTIQTLSRTSFLYEQSHNYDYSLVQFSHKWKKAKNILSVEKRCRWCFMVTCFPKE